MSLVTCHCLLTCPLAPPPLDQGDNGLIKYIVWWWPWTQNWGCKGTIHRVSKNKVWCQIQMWPKNCHYKTDFGNQDQDARSVLCCGLSVCERKDGGIFSGSDGMLQWRQFGMPVSICLFLGNLSGKSNNKNFSDIRYPGSLFRRETFGLETEWNQTLTQNPRFQSFQDWNCPILTVLSSLKSLNC